MLRNGPETWPHVFGNPEWQQQPHDEGQRAAKRDQLRDQRENEARRQQILDDLERKDIQVIKLEEHSNHLSNEGKVLNMKKSELEDKLNERIKDINKKKDFRNIKNSTK